MKLDVVMEDKGEGIVVLRVDGDVTLQTSPRLREALKPLLTKQTREIHVDLSAVKFMDSSGIATLVEGLQWAREHEGQFVLHKLQMMVRDVFSLAKLDMVFDISEADA
ncbi:MAG: STAS domain-containing protein [Mariprofundaceae bacterium]